MNIRTLGLVAVLLAGCMDRPRCSVGDAVYVQGVKCRVIRVHQDISGPKYSVIYVTKMGEIKDRYVEERDLDW